MTLERSLDDLAKRLPGRVGLPGAAIYEAARNVFAVGARRRRPLAAVRPRDRDEVAAVVAWSAEYGVPVSPRSGGHSLDGFCIQEQAVVLDLSDLRTVTLEDNGYLRAKCGATNIDIATAIGSGDHAVPIGGCPTVGLGGLIAGGGFGYCSRRLGLISDALEEATLVRCDGTIVKVSETDHPDLFWACRGGGGSVGIVTDTVLRTELVPFMTTVTMTWRWDRVREAFALYADCFRRAPETLDLTLGIRTTGAERYEDMTLPGPPDTEPGTPFVHIEGNYMGPRDEALDLLRGFLTDPGLIESNVQTRSFHDAEIATAPIGVVSEAAPKNLRPCRIASDFAVGYLEGPGVEAVLRFIEKLQWAPALQGGAFLIEPTGGRIATPDRPSAFAHREADILLQWLMLHDLPLSTEMTARHDDLLEEVREGLAGILTGGRYPNYADRLDCPEHWWRENLDCLRNIVSATNPRGLLISRLTPFPRAVD